MKTAKKALALLLAVLMCASLFTTMAFADNAHPTFPSREPTHVKILSIGTNIDTDVTTDGEGNVTEVGLKKYPYIAAERLQKIVGSSIAVSLETLDQGKDTYMTASLLRSILTEGAYYNESSQYNQEAYKAYLTGFEIVDGKTLTEAEQMKAAYNRYVDGIKGKGITVTFNSDATSMTLVVDTNPPASVWDMYSSVITVDLINASLTPYLMERLTAMMGNVNEDGRFLGDAPTFRGDLPAKVHEQAVTGSGDMIQLLLENLYTEAFIGVQEEYQPIVRAVCNAVSYTVFNFYADFKQDLEYIKWANPLAKLVVVGGYNDLEGLKIKLDDTYTIDFGSFWGAVINIVNSAICNDQNSAAYQFADLSTNRYVESRFGSIMNAAQEAKTFEKQLAVEGLDDVFTPVNTDDVDELLAKDIKHLVIDPVLIPMLQKLLTIVNGKDVADVVEPMNALIASQKAEALDQANLEKAALTGNTKQIKAEKARIDKELEETYKTIEDTVEAPVIEGIAAIVVDLLNIGLDDAKSIAKVIIDLYNYGETDEDRAEFIAGYNDESSDPLYKEITDLRNLKLVPNADNTKVISLNEAAQNTLQAFADAGKVTKLAVTELGDADVQALLMKCMFYRNGNGADQTLYNDPALLKEDEATMLNLLARFFVGGKLDMADLMPAEGEDDIDLTKILGNGLQPGIGLQPSDDSQDEIGEAVFQAIWEWETASMKGEDATLTIFDNIFGGILNTFRTPILETINTVFSNMLHGVVDWFSNFFSNLFNR